MANFTILDNFMATALEYRDLTFYGSIDLGLDVMPAIVITMCLMKVDENAWIERMYNLSMSFDGHIKMNQESVLFVQKYFT